jgi:hypothetical protein
MKIHYLALADTVTAPGGRYNEYKEQYDECSINSATSRESGKGRVSRTKHCRYCNQDAALVSADRQKDTEKKDSIGRPEGVLMCGIGQFYDCDPPEVFRYMTCHTDGFIESLERKKGERVGWNQRTCKWFIR